MRNGITVGQLIDLIDYNRDGQEKVKISEFDEKWNVLWTDSTILDQISNYEVDSIGTDDEGIICIFITDNEIEDYWEKVRIYKKLEAGEDVPLSEVEKYGIDKD